MAMCKKYDADGSGTIDAEEFLAMAKVLVGSRKNFFDSIPWKFGSGEGRPGAGLVAACTEQPGGSRAKGRWEGLRGSPKGENHIWAQYCWFCIYIAADA
jgi:hypothetical protein